MLNPGVSDLTGSLNFGAEEQHYAHYLARLRLSDGDDGACSFSKIHGRRGAHHIRGSPIWEEQLGCSRAPVWEGSVDSVYHRVDEHPPYFV